MDYSKITLLANKQRKQKGEIAKLFGMSYPGLSKKFEKDTLKVSELEKLAEFFNVPVSYFFEDSPMHISEPEKGYRTCKECLKKEGEIERLEKMLNQEKAEVARLNQELGRIKPGERGKAG